MRSLEIVRRRGLKLMPVGVIGLPLSGVIDGTAPVRTFEVVRGRLLEDILARVAFVGIAIGIVVAPGRFEVAYGAVVAGGSGVVFPVGTLRTEMTR